MKRSVTALMIAVVLLFSSAAQAEKMFHDSRTRLLLHGAYGLRDGIELRAHFIPAPNLIGELAPHAYLGLGLKVAPWLDVEPIIGWDYKNDEPIMSVNIAPTFGKLGAWADIEFQLPSRCTYWFANLDYQFFAVLFAGIEGEGWGTFKGGSSWSNGGGPNLFLQLKMVRLDVALHFRELDGSAKPEFVTRFHVFF